MDLWAKFVAVTAVHFRFLETEFGFVRKSSEPPFAIYETEKLQVSIYYEVGRRYELDLGIRRLSDDVNKTPAIGLTETMFLTDLQVAEKSRLTFPSTVEALEIEVARLAKELRRYGPALLKGDDCVFERIERLRRDRENEINAHVTHVNRLKL